MKRYKLEIMAFKNREWVGSSVRPYEFDSLEDAWLELTTRVFNGSSLIYRILDTEIQKPVNSQD